MQSKTFFSTFLSILFLAHTTIFAGLVPGTQILTPGGMVPVEDLTVDSLIIGFDKNGSVLLPEVPIKNILAYSVNQIIAIRTTMGTFYASSDQNFFDIHTGTQVLAKDLTAASKFLTHKGVICRVLYVECIDHESLVYDITVDYPHYFFSTDACILTHNLAGAAPFLLPAIQLLGRAGVVIASAWAGSRIFNNSIQANNQIASGMEVLCSKYRHQGKQKKFGIENVRQQASFNDAPAAIAGVVPDPRIAYDMQLYPNRYGPMCILGITTNTGDVACVLFVWRFSNWQSNGAASFYWQEIGQAKVRRDEQFVKAFVAAEDKKELDALRVAVKKWPAAAMTKLFKTKLGLEEEARQLKQQGCFEVNVIGVGFGIHAVHRLVQKNISPLMVLQAVAYGIKIRARSPQYIICSYPAYDLSILFDPSCHKVLNIGSLKEANDLEPQEEKKPPKTLDDILKDAKPGERTNGPSKQFVKPGNYGDALNDFNSLELSGVRDVDGIKLGILPDGRTVNVIISSSDKRPTLEIYDGKKSIKIRYGEK